MRLVLELRRLQERAELGTKKLDRVALVGLAFQTHPDQVNVVGHQAVRRANKTFPGCRVQHHFAKGGMEALIEPALLAVGYRHGPENDGVGLVEFAAQTREIMGELGTSFLLGIVAGRFIADERALGLAYRAAGRGAEIPGEGARACGGGVDADAVI